jgi:hypothetical protein
MLMSRVICQTNWNTSFYVVFELGTSTSPHLSSAQLTSPSGPARRLRTGDLSL